MRILRMLIVNQMKSNKKLVEWLEKYPKSNRNLKMSSILSKIVTKAHQCMSKPTKSIA